MAGFATDRETLERECEISFLRRGGPGGQHQNKTETAVRLFHPPSGVLLVVNDTRSQSMNRDTAFERLAERLRELNHVPRTRRRTRPTQGSKRRRLEGKKRRGEVKKGRQTPSSD